MKNASWKSPAFKSYPLLRTNYESLEHMATVINKTSSYISNRFRDPIRLAFTANDQHLLLLGMQMADTPENREKVFENGRQRGIEYQMFLNRGSDEENG